MNKKVLWICHAAMIAALYVVLTLCINAFGLASGAIQVPHFRSPDDFTIFYSGCHSRPCNWLPYQ